MKKILFIAAFLIGLLTYGQNEIILSPNTDRQKVTTFGLSGNNLQFQIESDILRSVDLSGVVGTSLVDPNSPNSPLFFLGTNAELLTAYPSFPTGAPTNLVVFEEDGTLASSDVSYDNSTSGLTATNVKTAIDELAASSTSDVEAIQIACSDLTTDITTGTTKAYFRMPYAMTLTDVRVSLLTAGTTTGITVDINESGVSVLSTLLTTDATEKTSETATTPAVISDSALADDAEITIDFDAVPTSGQGVIVTLIGTRV